MTTTSTTFETPAAQFWGETWFWEQVVYVLACLMPAGIAGYVSLAAKEPVSARDLVFLVLSASLQLVAQKARSAASRQAAMLTRRGMYVPEIRCAPSIKRWTQAGQVLGAFVSVATAPSWWHVPGILWAVVLYDLWRNHREARKEQR